MDNPLLAEFSVEAGELLDESEDALLELDKGKDPQECYNLVFRCFHSLKGSAGMMGLDDMQKHMHLVEDRFQSYSDKVEDLKGMVDYFLMSIDVAREIMKGNAVEFDYRVDQVFEKEEQDEFDELSRDLFKRMELPILVVGSGKASAKSIIESLPNKEVFCVATANKLDAVKELSKPITIIVKEEHLTSVTSYLEDKSDEHTLIVWGEKAHDKFLVWNEAMGGDALRIIIETLSENRVLKFAYNKAVMLLLYQLSDIEDFLIEKKKAHILKTLKVEIKELMEIKAKVRK
ncbi:Hpt domain-containing protein [Bacteriovorax sp. DB6_IX]|uniref:Hpt domain-containing protein n=1 Tax=Bacteriovorax sp. DB6_IX TaxID=1353530 RepID=UPI000389F4BA|nr:Hpt domain-containing protein [Bacteriovorax sp. DB6_IX]EQC50444.1 Hpt domain protein [Bacteriovorax sp. DB6_IX]